MCRARNRYVIHGALRPRPAIRAYLPGIYFRRIGVEFDDETNRAERLDLVHSGGRDHTAMLWIEDLLRCGLNHRHSRRPSRTRITPQTPSAVRWPRRSAAGIVLSSKTGVRADGRQPRRQLSRGRAHPALAAPIGRKVSSGRLRRGLISPFRAAIASSRLSAIRCARSRNGRPPRGGHSLVRGLGEDLEPAVEVRRVHRQRQMGVIGCRDSGRSSARPTTRRRTSSRYARPNRRPARSKIGPNSASPGPGIKGAHQPFDHRLVDAGARDDVRRRSGCRVRRSPRPCSSLPRVKSLSRQPCRGIKMYLRYMY